MNKELAVLALKRFLAVAHAEAEPINSKRDDRDEDRSGDERHGAGNKVRDERTVLSRARRVQQKGGNLDYWHTRIVFSADKHLA